jgi:hypothetical protein
VLPLVEVVTVDVCKFQLLDPDERCMESVLPEGGFQRNGELGLNCADSLYMVVVQS